MQTKHKKTALLIPRFLALEAPYPYTATLEQGCTEAESDIRVRVRVHVLVPVRDPIARPRS